MGRADDLIQGQQRPATELLPGDLPQDFCRQSGGQFERHFLALGAAHPVGEQHRTARQVRRQPAGKSGRNHALGGMSIDEELGRPRGRVLARTGEHHHDAAAVQTAFTDRKAATADGDRAGEQVLEAAGLGLQRKDRPQVTSLRRFEGRWRHGEP